MPFELEWGLALAAVAAFVGVLFLLPRKKKLPSALAAADGRPIRTPLFYAVLRSTWSNPAVYSVCSGEDGEALFVKVSWFHPDMSFGRVTGRGFLDKVMANGRTFGWLLVAIGGVAVVLAVAYVFGLRELASEYGAVLGLLLLGVPLLLGILLLVSPLSWLGAKAAEREFERESEKVRRLPLDKLEWAADAKLNLRADLADLTEPEVDRHFDDPDGKVATMKFRHPDSGVWTFDLYSEDDAEGAERMLGLKSPRRRSGRGRSQP